MTLLRSHWELLKIVVFRSLKSSKNAHQELIDNAKNHEKAFASEYLNTARDSRQFWHMLDKVTGKKAINIVEPLIKENNRYTFNDKEISDILTETHFYKKASSFDNYHKEAIEREVDKLLAEKPKNCMEQVALKEVQSAIKDLNSYSAPGPDRIGTLLIKNGGDYLHKTITDILNATCQLGCFPDTWKRDNRIYFKKS